MAGNMPSHAIFEPLPQGSGIIRVYNGIERRQCKSPVQYKFFTNCLPPVNGECELKGGASLCIIRKDFDAVLQEVNRVYGNVTHLVYDHNGKRHYYPRKTS